MRLPAAVGQSNVTRSRTFDAEDTINLYIERADAGRPKTDSVLYGTPGARVYGYFGEGPVRGVFAQDGRCVGVAGEEFGEIPNGGGAVINTATVADDGRPVSFASNGTIGQQVFFTSGGLGYIFDITTNTVTQITDVNFPADAILTAFMDAYFLVLQADSRRFQISALADGLDWDGLDVFERSEGSDHFVAMVQNHREIWLLGSKTSEVWVDTGDLNTPFQPIPGVFIEQGCVAPFSAKRVDNTIMWLGQDERGQGIVYLANGYTPQRVSTFAVEHFLSRSADLSLAEAFALQVQGHLWYALYVPDLDATITYDVSSQAWFKLARWDSAQAVWTPWLGRTACAEFGEVLVGDRASRAVYRLDFDTYTNEVAA